MENAAGRGVIRSGYYDQGSRKTWKTTYQEIQNQVNFV